VPLRKAADYMYEGESPTSDASTARAGCSPFAPRGRGRLIAQDPQLVVLSQGFRAQTGGTRTARHGAHTPPHPPLHLRPGGCAVLQHQQVRPPAGTTSCRAARWALYIPGELPESELELWSFSNRNRGVFIMAPKPGSSTPVRRNENLRARVSGDPHRRRAPGEPGRQSIADAAAFRLQSWKA